MMRIVLCISFASLLSLTASGDASPASALDEKQIEDEESKFDEDCSVTLLQGKQSVQSQADLDSDQAVLVSSAGKQPLPEVIRTPPVQEAAPRVKWSACAAEFIAMTLFVVIGCGSAMGIAKEKGSAWILQVSLTFGLAITSLAYAIGHYSGGQINCAVTLGLVIAGQLDIVQGICNFIAQMFGSLVGAFLLTLIYPEDKDLTGSLASNSISPKFTWASACLGEIMMTFLLVFVVLETATNPASAGNRALAALAIGIAVFLAHSVLIPIDGCSINPTRSFGPEIVARMRYGKGGSDHVIFWVGPLLGAAIAAGIQCALSV